MSTMREPPGRNGALELHIRFLVPALDCDDPALGLTTYYLKRIVVGNRTVSVDARYPSLVPLRAEDAGKTVDVVMSGPTLLPGETYVGSQRAIVAEQFRGDIFQYVIGTTLAIGGVFLLLGAAVRRSAREYLWMGAFALPIGLVSISQCELYAPLIYSDADFWITLHGLVLCLYPIGLCQFVVVVFGDTKRRLLRGLSLAFAVLAAGGVALQALSLATTSDTKKLALPLLLLATFVIVRRVWQQRHMPTARLFLGGFVTLFVIAIPDLLWSVGHQVFSINTSPFGIFAFAVAMAIVVETNFQDRAAQLKESREDLHERVVQLEQNRNQIESLNDELRHQLETRSRELRAALTGNAMETPLAPAKDLATGDVIGTRYRIVRHIGSGAMGAVYEVERNTDHGRFALKVMTGATSALAAARFAREAEMAAQVRHENLVAIVDVGMSDSRSPYLVLELVVGRTLEQASERYGDVKWALPILRDISAGLAALHKRGIVHRDLKPANVLLQQTAEGTERAKIADFGIAREGDDEAPLSVNAATVQLPSALASTLTDEKSQGHTARLTQTGALIGTPLYMAPEVATNPEVTRAADVFALALVAFEVLRNARPFDPPAVLQAMAGRQIRTPMMDASWAPYPTVAAALIRGLSGVPDERPTAADFEKIFSSAMGDQHGQASRAAPAPSASK